MHETETFISQDPENPGWYTSLGQSINVCLIQRPPTGHAVWMQGPGLDYLATAIDVNIHIQSIKQLRCFYSYRY